MSAKDRFLQKLQDNKARNGPFASKHEADIAEFRTRMAQLQEEVEQWLTGTGISVEGTSVSLVELLAGSETFSVPGFTLRYENRTIRFAPVFLYGQGVTGCVEVSLLKSGKVMPLQRLFMRSESHSSWTCSAPDSLSRTSFSEDAFFAMIEELVAE
ncbi:hypothetical protein EGM70_05750 [Enterobacteriaceae bacterium 89]|nr:hypothetical protein [Enterobacteriaceae bacterium 89]